MHRTPSQQISFLAALLFGVTPIVFGIARALSSADDYRFLWMSLAPSLFTAGVLAAAIGRRRTRRAVRVQATVIFIVATLLAATTALLFGATALPGMIAVSAVYGAFLSVASVLVAFSRARSH